MKAESPGIFHAVGETVARASDLVQLEFKLAKAELGEKATMAMAGFALAAAGAILLAAALLLILQFLVIALVAAGLSPMAATAVVAGFTIAVGLCLVAAGRKQFDTSTLTPRRTFNDLQRDSTIVKEKLS